MHQQCKTVSQLPKPDGEPQCPEITWDSFGICVHECSADYECPDGELCCGNGCGHTCQKGVIPIKDDKCPEVEEGSFGICWHECDSHEQCGDGMYCCSNGCGMTCTEPAEKEKEVAM